MTKADKILIAFIMVLSMILIVPIVKMAPSPKDEVSVKVKNKEVLRFSLLKDAEYEVQGTLGPVHIEVKNHAVRVSQENSPHHYCSMQGYVSDSNHPIVCLPNETIVEIEGNKSQEDVVIQ